MKPSYFQREVSADGYEYNRDIEERNAQKANEILDNFERHEINLNCTGFKFVNFEIVIDGLGWIGVQGNGFVNFILHLPPSVNFHVREDPIRPYLL